MLQHDITRPLLVITGVWNPAILQPPWIARYLLDKKEGEEFAFMEVGVPDRPTPIIYINDLGIAASRSRIDLFVNTFDPKRCNELEAMCAKILELLPHTPVTGLGVNHIFSVSNPQPQLLDKFKTRENIETAYRVIEQVLISRIELGENVKLNLRRQISSEKILFDLNFHHEANKADTIRALLPNVIERTYQQAIETIGSLYGEHDIEDRGHDFPKQETGGEN
ncbi:hypothetical protein [Rhodopseudomonas sp. BR0G17]|uniref:hypothetical protein n=1 Tax=Rhodopseudomonas sp. BR0G17 TaxID=2269368 RepID=UPI0013DFEA53|nr:hypothetical protein [Rhodopseudomonas sp. BR0G17]